MYAELTRAVGPVMVEEEEEEEEGEKSAEEDTAAGQEGTAGPVAVRRDTTQIPGRQKFGNTRKMKLYGMESPILAEFQK